MRWASCLCQQLGWAGLRLVEVCTDLEGLELVFLSAFSWLAVPVAIACTWGMAVKSICRVTYLWITHLGECLKGIQDVRNAEGRLRQNKEEFKLFESTCRPAMVRHAVGVRKQYPCAK